MNDFILIIPDCAVAKTNAGKLTALSSAIANSQLLRTINYDQPVLADWAQAIRAALQNHYGRMWIIAEGFACLAASVAVADKQESLAGLIFIDPADAEDFNILGFRSQNDQQRSKSIQTLLPDTPLAAFGLLLHHCAGQLTEKDAELIAEQWGLAFYPSTENDCYQPRFINRILAAMQSASLDVPHGDLTRDKPEKSGKGSVLANVRKHTREGLYYL